MFALVLASSSIVIGFHVLLKVFKQEKGDLSTNLHLIRRFQHFLTGIIIIPIYLYFPHSIATVLATVPAIYALIFDQIRRKYSPKLNAWFLSHWE